MLIVYCNSINQDLVKDRISERAPVADIIGLASTEQEARAMIIEHAKDRVNEDYRDGLASTRDEAWAEYLLSPQAIIQESAGPVINMTQYFVADAGGNNA